MLLSGVDDLTRFSELSVVVDVVFTCFAGHRLRLGAESSSILGSFMMVSLSQSALGQEHC